jgi:Holliday junction DNA helicase RuvA
MIARLRGRVVEKVPNRLTLDVQGVGYDVHVPLSTFYEVGDPGSEVELRIHTHVREEALQLFGFLTLIEQEVFERLIATSGIGPKLAIAVLSGIESADLVAAVGQGDAARLTRVPGVGRKTAERIVLELKDKLAHLTAPPGRSVPAAPGDRLRDDLVSALQNLGYHRPPAERAVDAVLADVTPGDAPPPFEEALRGALRQLTR